MNVLSLFDGISCGHLAFERANITVDNYYASEIDKSAIGITQKNYPNTIQLGDVSDIDFTQFIDKIDIIIGGSPCQDLSIANNNRKGLDGCKSGLFWKYEEAVITIKPKYFLLENVASMSTENRDIISKTLGVEPIFINSNLVSAQNRKRLYWTNIPNITIPENKNIKLSDILECDQDLSNMLYYIEVDDKNRRKIKPYPYAGCAFRTRLDETGKYKRLEINKDEEKSNALTTISTDSMVCECLTVCEATKKGYFHVKPGECVDLSIVNSKTRRGRSMIEKANCLMSVDPNFYRYLGVDENTNLQVIRKFTPIECERLQTLPDNYTNGLSNSKRYKIIGNGWTVDVIAHIFKHIILN